MDLEISEHYFILPESGKQSGRIYYLQPSECFAKNSFVLLPYVNPQTQAIVPKFFKIIKEVFIDDLSRLSKSCSLEGIIFTPQTSKSQYLEKIKSLQAEIQAGNIYEINYCTQFIAENIKIDPLDVFLKLNKLAKAPYSCLLKTGADFIICASPELFLKKEADLISTKPIKGTSRRGKDKIEDDSLKEQLQTSLKERTENVMAVDVARNDLSHFAERGSVKVNQLYNIETFETVHQMVSTVSCVIKEEILALDSEKLFNTIVDATFPMASMTGAPKLRAMTLIDAHEDFERKAYSGAMGLIDEKEDFTLGVIIRSLFYNATTKILSFSVGGAITYLSEAEEEYEECLLKAEALLKVLNAQIAH